MAGGCHGPARIVAIACQSSWKGTFSFGFNSRVVWDLAAPSSQERGARYSESSPSSRFATPSSLHTNPKVNLFDPLQAVPCICGGRSCAPAHIYWILLSITTTESGIRSRRGSIGKPVSNVAFKGHFNIMVIVCSFWVNGVETPYQIGRVPFARTILKFKRSFDQELVVSHAVIFWCVLGVDSTSRHDKRSMT